MWQTYRSLLIVFFVAGLFAGCSTTRSGQEDTSAAPSGASISGVYSTNFSGTSGYVTATLDLRQSGSRVSGTYFLRSAGQEISAPVTGTYRGAQLNLRIRTPDPAEFVGMVSPDGNQIEGRLSEEFGDSYTVVFSRN